MRLPTIALTTILACVTHTAIAQAAPERDSTWGAISTVSLVVGAGTELLMPRILYPEPEVTMGWKPRWHVSVLAPTGVLVGLALLNEFALKDAIKGNRPGCSDETNGTTGCETYGMLSTHAYGGFAALGHGAAVFFFDTTKWSNNRFNAASLVGHVAIPFVAAGLNAIGRGVGNWESGAQIVAGGAAGLATGFLMGSLYTVMKAPECGYSGSVICW
jgi:hypothetical protein